MAFPPGFLDELRARVSLAAVVGRRVKLVKRGREFIGLCPFHKEKTPSFSVVEDKAFYHCFGCGAHGDVIGFVMQTENLAFPEAVEQLARQAGLEVPRQTGEERETAARQATLHGAVEAACAFFEETLHAPQGRDARLYLERRGLDLATIRRFRLGFALEARDGLKRLLAKSFPEPLLVEAGLLRRPEQRRELRLFPQPRHLPDRRSAGPHHRLRRPRARATASRNISTRPTRRSFRRAACSMAGRRRAPA